MSSLILSLKPEEIRLKLIKGELTICVVGLGWMGLPTACLFAEAGANVVGVDVNSTTVEKVGRGECPIEEPRLNSILKANVRSGRLKVTTDLVEASSSSDVNIIIVPINVGADRKPDYSAVKSSCSGIAKGMRRGCLVIFESTCAPGVTETLVKATLERFSGFRAGLDFGLAYSPIRAMSGRALDDLRNYCRVVGGFDERGLKAASAVLSAVVENRIVEVRDLKTAEASKIFESIYRDVNIALANEFAIYCENAGLDYFEAMHAANTQPYSHLHLPGVGVGGHCLPVYPYLLMDEAKRVSAKLTLVGAARKTNEEMPKHVVRVIADGLKACRKSLARAKITVLGVAYRANANETRLSPAVELIGLLKRRGARVRVFDPKLTAEQIASMGYRAEATLRGAVGGADCVAVTVAHDEFRKLNIIELAVCMSKPSLLVDCAGMFNPFEVEKAGLVYRGVGRGILGR